MADSDSLWLPHLSLRKLFFRGTFLWFFFRNYFVPLISHTVQINEVQIHVSEWFSANPKSFFKNVSQVASEQFLDIGVMRAETCPLGQEDTLILERSTSKSKPSMKLPLTRKALRHWVLWEEWAEEHLERDCVNFEHLKNQIFLRVWSLGIS